MADDNKAPTDTPAASAVVGDRLRDLIYGMKLRGQQCPVEIDIAIWDSVEVRGATARDYVVQTYREQLIKQAATQMQKLPDDVKSQINAISSLALDQLVSVMTDPLSRPGERLQASTYVLDHTVGKAKQEVEHSGNLALEIRAQAKRALELESGMRDATPKESSDKLVATVDAFLEKHVKDTYVVGEKENIDDEQTV